mgnify:CR=1 FL=1
MTQHTPPWLHIVGIGEDGLAGLVPATRAVVEAAALDAHGAGDVALIGRYTRQGVYLGIFLAIPIMWFAWFLSATTLCG